MEIYKIADYEKFRMIKGNRNINALHIKRLKASMMKQFLISPIIVNENFEIIDGQHRFEAQKELELPIYYIVCPGYGLREVQIFNSNSKNWKLQDFLNGYCDLNYPHYLDYRDFQIRYGFGETTNLEILSGSNAGESYKNFREGKFVIHNLEISNKYAEMILDFKDYPGFKRRNFVSACLQMFKIKGYDHSLMKEKLRYLSVRLMDCTTTKEYLKLLEGVYNYKSRNGNLRFF